VRAETLQLLEQARNLGSVASDAQEVLSYELQKADIMVATVHKHDEGCAFTSTDTLRNIAVITRELARIAETFIIALGENRVTAFPDPRPAEPGYKRNLLGYKRKKPWWGPGLHPPDDPGQGKPVRDRPDRPTRTSDKKCDGCRRHQPMTLARVGDSEVPGWGILRLKSPARVTGLFLAPKRSRKGDRL
jgi:hypothetical protein